MYVTFTKQCTINQSYIKQSLLFQGHRAVMHAQHYHGLDV